jgi:hypothetical protein
LRIKSNFEINKVEGSGIVISRLRENKVNGQLVINGGEWFKQQ